MQTEGRALVIWIGKKDAYLIEKLDELSSIVGIKRNKLVVRILRAFIEVYYGRKGNKALEKEVKTLKKRVTEFHALIMKSKKGD